MASACLNRIGISPENLLECPPKYSSYGWFSPRLSIGREMNDEDASKSKAKRISSPVKNLSDLSEVSDPKDFGGLESRLEDPAKELSDLPEEQDPKEFDGFEFRLDDPVMMLPADELFSDGKLVPLQLSVIHQEVATSTTTIMSGVRIFKIRRYVWFSDLLTAETRSFFKQATTADQIEANESTTNLEQIALNSMHSVTFDLTWIHQWR
ncbi:hypothetical protein L1987_02493 [Smallanthus sonchifolius]|uniref:Uncharacterized protein n=1 Tax=Smallanthus sonchifolius TaxID=185202 RepID=A0ACB9K7X7_9ASTR|nr:hypothetical protein L1987_02493 [Smallanthus sonchifolius]